MRGESLLIFGYVVKGQFWQSIIYVEPFGYNTYCGFSTITFKLHMYVVDDEMRNTILIFVYGVKGHKKKEEILLNPVLKAPTRTEMSKG